VLAVAAILFVTPELYSSLLGLVLLLPVLMRQLANWRTAAAVEAAS
jgi:UPF0716 family protein affecting phage T7 exclusion